MEADDLKKTNTDPSKVAEKEKEAAALLGLPDDIRQFALLPVAYTTKDDFKPAMRQPLDTVLHWNQW